MLTSAQQVTLKADILADAALNTLPPNSDSAFEIARVYNLDAAGTYIVWRGSMPVVEIEQNGFAWSSLDSVPEAKYRIWARLTAPGFINPTKANVRQGIQDFCRDSINQPIVALRDSILPHLKEQASRVEKLFATGAGTNVSPSVKEFEGPLAVQDVMAAMGW